MGIKIQNANGGSVELVADPNVTTDEQMVVSGSHGIESGDEYIKFPDGTMIVHQRYVNDNINISTASGQLFRAGPYTVTFAEPFVGGTPIISLQWVSGQSDVWVSTVNWHSNTSADFYILSANQKTGIQAYIDVQAIGRWK